MNTRVPHLEEETIFGTAKRKLDLLLRDESDSHRHDRVNYYIPMVGRRMSPAQAWNVFNASTILGHSLSSVNNSTPLSIFGKLKRTLAVQLAQDHPQALTTSGLPILESACSDPTQWQIERISSNVVNVCCGRFEGRRCNAKIARYRQAFAAPTFMGIEKHSRAAESQQVEFWFYPNKLHICVSGNGCRWILYFPTVPQRWPIKFGTNLTQAEVSSFESVRFVLEDGIAKVEAEFRSGNELHGTKVLSGRFPGAKHTSIST